MRVDTEELIETADGHAVLIDVLSGGEGPPQITVEGEWPSMAAAQAVLGAVQTSKGIMVTRLQNTADALRASASTYQGQEQASSHKLSTAEQKDFWTAGSALLKDFATLGSGVIGPLGSAGATIASTLGSGGATIGSTLGSSLSKIDPPHPTAAPTHMVSADQGTPDAAAPAAEKIDSPGGQHASQPQQH